MSARDTAVILLSLLSCLTTSLGVALALSPRENAHFLAFAAGAMLFVSVHELVPMARRYPHGNFFFLGILLSALIYALLAGMTVG